MNFPGGSDGKESSYSAGGPSSIPELEKGMATHSSILAWRIPWTEEPGGLRSTGSQRVRQETNTVVPLFSYQRFQFISRMTSFIR